MLTLLDKDPFCPTPEPAARRPGGFEHVGYSTCGEDHRRAAELGMQHERRGPLRGHNGNQRSGFYFGPLSGVGIFKIPASRTHQPVGPAPLCGAPFEASRR